MYIQLQEPKKKCSKCGAIDQTDIIIRENTYKSEKCTYLHCTVCGHEKLILTESWASNTTSSVIYNTVKRPEIEEF